MKLVPARVGRARVGVLFAATVVAIGVLPVARADVAGGSFKRLSVRLPVTIPPEGSVGVRTLIDSGLRRAYQMYDLAPGVGIRVFDLDSLREVAYRKLDLAGSIYLTEIDEAGHRLLLPYEIDSGTSLVSRFGGVKVLDGRDLQEIADWRRPATGMGIEASIVGMSYFAPQGVEGSRKLLFVFQEDVWVKTFVVGQNLYNPVWVQQWDAVTGEPDWPAYRAAACRGLFPGTGIKRSTHAFFRSAREPAIYLGCTTPEGTGLSLKVYLDESGVPLREDPYPGPVSVKQILADPTGERLLFAVTKEGDESLFVFEASKTSYVGAIGISRDAVQGVGYGFDDAIGRVYAQTGDKGVLLMDSRRTPLAQALAFPAFKDPGGADIVVDFAAPGRPRRIYVRPGAADFYWVYEDTIRQSTSPKLSDRDSLTAGRAEEDGVTGVNFEASAHAYGLRMLLVGGVEGLFTERVREQVRGAGSPCTFYDREVVGGLVESVVLANQSASGRTFAADADPGTKTDLKEPSGRCWPDPRPAGFTFFPDGPPRPGRDFDPNGDIDRAAGIDWPFEKTECSGVEEKESRNATLSGFVASTRCDSESELVEGFAQARAVTGTAFSFAPAGVPVLFVAEAGAKSVLDRGAKGVLARTEAWAKGITVVGVGTIDMIYSEAVAQAAGLKGSAKGSHTSYLCGVNVGLYQQQGCTRDRADMDRAVTAINQALGARGRFRLPAPDQELLNGSPGGYQASVQKDRFEELSSRALNNDFTTQVAGAELVMLNDSATLGRARQVFQFAGVDASTSYGIFLLTKDFGAPTEVLGEYFESSPSVGGEVLPSFDSEPPPAPSSDPLFRTIIRKIKAGLAIAARSPREASLVAAVWATLGLPVFMAIRRRRLGRSLRLV